MATSQSSDSPANVLLKLIDGHRVTAVIYVAARLGIADLLIEGPKSVPELARLTDTHERSLFRLMRALVKLAICTEASDGRFNLTEMGTHLAADCRAVAQALGVARGRDAENRLARVDRVDTHRQDRAGLGGTWPGALRGLAKTKEQACSTKPWSRSRGWLFRTYSRRMTSPGSQR